MAEIRLRARCRGSEQILRDERRQQPHLQARQPVVAGLLGVNALPALGIGFYPLGILTCPVSSYQ